jgi:hypothetical protein
LLLKILFLLVVVITFFLNIIIIIIERPLFQHPHHFYSTIFLSSPLPLMVALILKIYNFNYSIIITIIIYLNSYILWWYHLIIIIHFHLKNNKILKKLNFIVIIYYYSKHKIRIKMWFQFFTFHLNSFIFYSKSCFSNNQTIY